jgi:hypothetical protein
MLCLVSLKINFVEFSKVTRKATRRFLHLLLDVHQSVPGCRLLLGLHNIPSLFTADYFLSVISSNGYYEVRYSTA